MTTETLSTTKQPAATATSLRAFIYSVFFQNVKAEHSRGSYGRTSMGL